MLLHRRECDPGNKMRPEGYAEEEKERQGIRKKKELQREKAEADEKTQKRFPYVNEHQLEGTLYDFEERQIRDCLDDPDVAAHHINDRHLDKGDAAKDPDEKPGRGLRGAVRPVDVGGQKKQRPE